MKKKRYLIIACLLFSPSFFINVEASDGGSSSVGVEFYRKNPAKVAPQKPSPKTDAPAASPQRDKLALHKEVIQVVVRHKPPRLARSSLAQGARVR